MKAKYLTHDQSRIDSFNQDSLITRPIAVNILLELYKTADRVVEDASAITLPTQLFISGNDHVVHANPQHLFYERLNTSIKEKHVLPGFYHDTLGERDRVIPINKMRSFIETLLHNHFINMITNMKILGAIVQMFIAHYRHHFLNIVQKDSITKCLVVR